RGRPPGLAAGLAGGSQPFVQVLADRHRPVGHGGRGVRPDRGQLALQPALGLRAGGEPGAAQLVALPPLPVPDPVLADDPVPLAVPPRAPAGALAFGVGLAGRGISARADAQNASCHGALLPVGAESPGRPPGAEGNPAGTLAAQPPSRPSSARSSRASRSARLSVTILRRGGGPGGGGGPPRGAPALGRRPRPPRGGGPPGANGAGR